MCVLCERTALALGDAVLPSNLLIDTSNVAFSQGQVASDGVMDLYLHAPGGAVHVSGGGFGGQTIESVPIPQQDQDYIRSIVSRLFPLCGGSGPG
jgi:serralysin